MTADKAGAFTAVLPLPQRTDVAGGRENASAPPALAPNATAFTD